MWMADQRQDYELLDCGGGEKLERWGSQILVRPDPQAIWETDHSDRLWQKADAGTAVPPPAAATGTKSRCRSSGPSATASSPFWSSP